jgi:hypothetical protein
MTGNHVSQHQFDPTSRRMTVPVVNFGPFTLEPDTAAPFDLWFDDHHTWHGPVSIIPFVSDQTQGWDQEQVQLRVQWVASTFTAPDQYGYACGIYNTSSKKVTFLLEVWYSPDGH